MAWYRAGTCSLTSGGVAVTGAGTAWIANAQAGDAFKGPDEKLYEVQSVNSDTSITLASNYAGTPAAGAAYAIIPTQGRVRDLAAQVLQLITDYGAVEGALTVDSGRVGLGKTPNASAKLDVAGQVWVDAPGGDATVRLLTSGAEKGKLAATSAGRVYFESNGVEAMTLLNGNVGIGASSPGAMLHVAAAGTGRGAGDLISETLGANGNAGLAFRTAGVDRWSITAVGTDGANGLRIRDENAGAERMRIASSGDVLIGKAAVDLTNPGCYFEPAGALGYGRLNFIKGTASGVGATAAIAFYYNGASVGRVECASTSTTFVTSSDERLKTHIAPAGDAGAILDRIGVVSYDWLTGGSVPFGVIAQDLHAVFPDAVSVGDEAATAQESPWGVDYSKLVPLLVREVQSLRARVAALQAGTA